MPTESVKITEKNILSPAETNGSLRRELDEFLFHEGTAHRAHTYLGAHAETDGQGEERIVFRVWAPNAAAVSVVGSFSDWECGLPMERVTEGGIFMLSLPGGRVPDGSLYKYRIQTADGRILLRADPYGRAMENPPFTATRFLRARPFPWHDGGWLRQRVRLADAGHTYPLNIYELHPGSWKYKGDGAPLGYRELADELAPYVKQMGFTHVELMPIMEHTDAESCGYGVSGYFAPTARYGSPDDFRAFVDIMHNAGVGVILDWPLASFPRAADGAGTFNGLALFDGAPLYESPDSACRASCNGDGCLFDLGRKEVVSFLLSNAYYWIEEFHADGLRVDGLPNLLYLNYNRCPGDWKPNRYGGNQSPEAIAFFTRLNRDLGEDHRDVMTIADESPLWPHVTDLSKDGLGFTHKWNLGWTNATLHYLREDPIFRKHSHDLITRIPPHTIRESYVLPISHEAVSHPDGFFLENMPGDYWRKFAGARVFAAWMMTLPGAKLWFMGSEIGRFEKWTPGRQPDWCLLDYEAHARLQHYFAALNNLYLHTPALWDECTDEPEDSFRWLEASNAEQSIISFCRIPREGQELTVILNFTPATYEDHPMTVPLPGLYREIFNSDDPRYGGSGVLNPGILEAHPATEGALHRVRMRVPPMGCSILERIPDEPRG